MPKLIVTAGPLEGHTFRLEGDALIGRAEDCDVCIPEPWISRQHARIIHRQGSYFVEDLGTRNGTLVNGKLVAKALLCSNDRITVGNCELTFVTGKMVSRHAHTRLDDGITSIVHTLGVDRLPEHAADADAQAVVPKLRAHLRVLQEVADAACGTFEIDHLLYRILDQLLHVYPQAKHAHAVLFGLAEDGSDLQLSNARDGSAVEAGMSRTLLELATRQQQAVLASDTIADERISDARSIVGVGLRSIMCCPLLVREKVVGAIQVDTTDVARPFTLDDLQLLVTVAGHVAVTAENAQLHRRAVDQQRLAAIGQTMSSLAHCIKNVLNGVKGGAYILDQGIDKQDVERTAKGWDMVRRNTDFMSVLVMDMLTYCRKEAAPREPTDLGALLDEVAAMIRESAGQKGIELSLEVADGLPQVSLEPVGVKRTILNLLTNAIEACAEGGHVRLAACRGEGECIHLTVQDDGAGIPEEARRRLFEPFFTTKGKGGTGLGLPLVKKIVDEHGGTIRVDSQEGEGTTFHISLPAGA